MLDAVYRFRPDEDNIGSKSEHPLRWPHPTTIRKAIRLDEDTLHVTFIISNEDDQEQCMQFGWHPSFIADGGYLRYAGKKHRGLKDFEEDSTWVGTGPMEYHTDGATVRVEHDFGRSAIWRRGKQVCLEMFTHGMNGAAGDDLRGGRCIVVPPHSDATYSARFILS